MRSWVNDRCPIKRLSLVDTAPKRVGKPVVLGVLGISAVLIIVSALLPSPEQRQIEVQKRKLIGLKPVAPPRLPSSPAVSVRWPKQGDRRVRRPMAIHAYLKVGVKTNRADLLNSRYMGINGQTNLHISFDPKDEEQVRLVTALALKKPESDPRGEVLLHDAFIVMMTRRKPGHIPWLVKQQLRRYPAEQVAKARARVLAELADGSATAYPAGTVLYAAGDRFYREPKPKTPTGSSSFGGLYWTYSSANSDILEALSDARVPLP